MEIRHLLYFKAVAETLSFTKAARLLHISQPPLSRQIKELELELGKELLLRNTSKVSLTQAGTYFLQETLALLERLEGAKHLVREMDNTAVSVLRIGYMSSFPTDILTDILKELNFRFPFLKTSLFELPTYKQLKYLESGKLDAGILRGPAFGDHLHCHSLLQDKFSIVHRASDKIDRKMLSAQKFIAFNREYARYYHAQLLACCHYLGFEPSIAHEANNMQMILDMVQNGLGISIVPSIVQRACGNRSLQFQPLQRLPLTTEIVFARSTACTSPAMAVMGTLAEELLAGAAGNDTPIA